jgi:anaerobic selenocysteine-containing dehydrogenase
MSDKQILTRREFLKLTGIITGGMALSSPLFSQAYALSEKVLQTLKHGPRKESWRVTACRLCPDGCSLLVRRIDGIPISLKGNPHSPINRGGLCPAAYANLEILYHPDRYTEPLARPEGLLRKKLATVPWDEAVASVTKSINDLINRKQAYRIAVINGDDTPLMQAIWENFARALGTPNFYQEDHCGLNDNSTLLTQGYREIPRLDLINSECIISLGANFLETDGAPVHFHQVINHFKDLERITRNKLIYVGPRANITATSAHRWIPIYPDTWGTLALGIAHILIAENAVDQDFLARYANGYRDWVDEQGRKHPGFETQVLSEFHPRKVEEITGVAEKDIYELAELLMTRENSVVLCGSEALQTPRGDLHQWAVHCLNFLAGNIQHPGGWYFTGKRNRLSPRLPYRGKEVQNLFFTDEGHPLEKPSLDIFAKRMEGYSPYKIELLIINQANPAYFGENRAKWKATLKHIPRVVYIGDLPNETSAYADVILPAHSPFETWDLVEDVPTLPFASATLQREVIEPMYNTRPSYEILRSIVNGVDGIPTSFVQESRVKDLVRNRLQQIHAEKRGTLFGQHTDEEWKDTYIHHRSFRLGSSQKKFLKSVLKTGGWWDPAQPVSRSLPEVLATDSGKFELLHPVLTRMAYSPVEESQLLKSLLGSRSYPPALIRYAPTGEEGFPLILFSGFPNTNPYGRTVYSPSLLETVGNLREMYWECWVEIHPKTAHQYGVRDGELIQLDSQVGVLQVRARVRPFIQPGVLYVPLGLGRENVGRFGSGVGQDARQLMVPQPDVNTGNMILSGTPVRITRL